MGEEWKLQGLVTKRRETKRGLSAQRNTKLSPLPLLSPKNLSITKHILPSCFYSFFHTHAPRKFFSHLKKNPLDLQPTLFKINVIQNQAPGLLLQLFSFNFFLFSLTYQYNVELVEICPSSQHVNTQVVWASDTAGEKMCVYSRFF